MKQFLVFLLLLIITLAFSNAQISPQTKLADSYFDKAELFYETAKDDSAMMYYEKASQLYSDHKNWNRYLRSKSKSILTLSNLNRTDEAFLKINELIDESELLPEANEIEKAFANYVRGNILGFNKNDQVGGIKILIEVANSQKKNGQIPVADLSDTYFKLGNLYSNRGMYDSVIYYQQLALPLRIHYFGDQHLETAKIHNNLANGYLGKGDTQKALELHLKALRVREQKLGKIHFDVASSYNNIGVVYTNMGNSEQALDNLLHALSIRKKILGENHLKVAQSYMNLGNLMTDLKRFNEGLYYHRLGLNIRKKLLGNDHILLTESYMNLSTHFCSHNQFDSALFYARKANDWLLENLEGKHVYIGSSFSYIAQAFMLTESDSSLYYYHKAIEVYKELFGEKNYRLGIVYKDIAIAYGKKDELDEALHYCQKSLIASSLDFDRMDVTENPSLNNLLGDYNLINILSLKAKLFVRKFEIESNDLSDLQMSFKTFILCDQLIDKLRISHQNYTDRVSLEKDAVFVYEWALYTSDLLYELTQRPKYLEQVYYFIEKSKAQHLLLGVLDSKALKFSNVPGSLLDEERNLKIDITYYLDQKKQEQRAESPDTDKVEKLNLQLLRLMKRQDSLNAKLESEYPNYYQLKYKITPVSVKKVQSLIDSNTAIVEYFLGDSVKYVLLITKDNFQAIKLPALNRLPEEINRLNESLTNSNASQFSEVSNALYCQLLAPIAESITSQTKLIIVPDKLLWYLNFDILISSRSDVADFRKLNYLINKYTISYSYSTNMLLHQMDQNFGIINNQCLAFSYEQSSPMDEGYLMKMSAFRDFKGGELPGTKKEIKAISDLMDGSYYFGKYANERNFKQHSSNYGILHLAVHGDINEKEPLQSSLYFGQEESGSSEDNYLHCYELFDMELNAALAVLSACKSGAGKIENGDGIVSLGTAFIYAGVKSLVVSQWDVSDKITPLIMQQFYTKLVDGLPKDEALRYAKLNFLKENSDNLSANPYYWAPLIFIGDATPLPTQSLSGLYIPGIAMALVLILVFLYIMRLNRKF